MNLPISLYVALRYWRAKSADRFGRLVTNLASLGIVLGVMALIIVLSVMNGLESCGFIIDYFDTLRNAADARRAGANIG